MLASCHTSLMCDGPVASVPLALDAHPLTECCSEAHPGPSTGRHALAFSSAVKRHQFLLAVGSMVDSAAMGGCIYAMPDVHEVLCNAPGLERGIAA